MDNFSHALVKSDANKYFNSNFSENLRFFPIEFFEHQIIVNPIFLNLIKKF